MQVSQQQSAAAHPPTLPAPPKAVSALRIPVIDVEAAAKYPELVFDNTNGTGAPATKQSAYPNGAQVEIPGPSKIPSPIRKASAAVVPPTMVVPAAKPVASAVAISPTMQSPPATAIPSAATNSAHTSPSAPTQLSSFPVEPSRDSPPSPKPTVSYPPVAGTQSAQGAPVPPNLEPVESAAGEPVMSAPQAVSVAEPILATSYPPALPDMSTPQPGEPVQATSYPPTLPAQQSEPVPAVAPPTEACNGESSAGVGVAPGAGKNTSSTQAQAVAGSIHDAKICDADANANKHDALADEDVPADGTREFKNGGGTRGFRGGFSSRLKRFIGREIMRMVCGGGGGGKWGRRRRRRPNHGYGGHGYGGGWDGYGGGHGGYGGGYGGHGGYGCNGHGHGHGHGHHHGHGHGHGRPPRHGNNYW